MKHFSHQDSGGGGSVVVVHLLDEPSAAETAEVGGVLDVDPERDDRRGDDVQDDDGLEPGFRKITVNVHDEQDDVGQRLQGCENGCKDGKPSRPRPPANRHDECVRRETKADNRHDRATSAGAARKPEDADSNVDAQAPHQCASPREGGGAPLQNALVDGLHIIVHPGHDSNSKGKLRKYLVLFFK